MCFLQDRVELGLEWGNGPIKDYSCVSFTGATSFKVQLLKLKISQYWFALPADKC